MAAHEPVWCRRDTGFGINGCEAIIKQPVIKSWILSSAAVSKHKTEIITYRDILLLAEIN